MSHANMVRTNQPTPAMAPTNVRAPRAAVDVNADSGVTQNPKRSFEVVPTVSGTPGSMPFSPGPAHGAGGW